MPGDRQVPTQTQVGHCKHDETDVYAEGRESTETTDDSADHQEIDL